MTGDMMTNMIETPVFDEMLALLNPEDRQVITTLRIPWNFKEADARLRPSVEAALKSQSQNFTLAGEATSSSKSVGSAKPPAQAKPPVKRKPRNTTPK